MTPQIFGGTSAVIQKSPDFIWLAFENKQVTLRWQLSLDSNSKQSPHCSHYMETVHPPPGLPRARVNYRGKKFHHHHHRDYFHSWGKWWHKLRQPERWGCVACPAFLPWQHNSVQPFHPPPPCPQVVLCSPVHEQASGSAPLPWAAQLSSWPGQLASEAAALSLPGNRWVDVQTHILCSALSYTWQPQLKSARLVALATSFPSFQWSCSSYSFERYIKCNNKTCLLIVAKLYKEQSSFCPSTPSI